MPSPSHSPLSVTCSTTSLKGKGIYLQDSQKRLSLWGEQSAKGEGERVEQEDTLKKELRNEKFGVLCVSDEKFPKKISQNPG